VELTPLEQDVYALMGVSPLIRLDQEFKDPKAVIVAVKTKGDSSVPDAESKAIPEPTLETSLPKADNDVIKLKPEILTLGRRQRSTPIASEPDFSSLSVMADPKTETEEPGMSFKEPMFKEEIEPPIVRRRKRRSSAQEDDW
jgi:ribonuclease E